MCPFSPILPSHPGCHITLSGIPCALSRSLLVVHFKYSSVYMSVPNPLTILYTQNRIDFYQMIFFCVDWYDCVNMCFFQFVSMWVTLILNIELRSFVIIFMYWSIVCFFFFFEGFPCSSVRKESACRIDSLSSISWTSRI